MEIHCFRVIDFTLSLHLNINMNNNVGFSLAAWRILFAINRNGIHTYLLMHHESQLYVSLLCDMIQNQQLDSKFCKALGYIKLICGMSFVWSVWTFRSIHKRESQKRTKSMAVVDLQRHSSQLRTTGFIIMDDGGTC